MLDRRPEPGARVGGYPIAGLIRRVRRLADLSQRELARAARVSRSTVARVEAGTLTPSIDVFTTLLAAANMSLAVVDYEGHVVLPMEDHDTLLDGADRRYPAHLDVIVDPVEGEWWADIYGLARPPETFLRDRVYRDERRRRSQWEVRVAKHRHEPPPRRPPIV